MRHNALLVNYGLCNGCDKCVAACCQVRNCLPDQCGLVLAKVGPYVFPSGKELVYRILTPTDFCDCCHSEESIPPCTAACSLHCIEWGDIQTLGNKMTEKTMALFTLSGKTTCEQGDKV